VNEWRWGMCYKFYPVLCPQFITWKVSEDKRPDKLVMIMLHTTKVTSWRKIIICFKE
jgi:hypothetical protein